MFVQEDLDIVLPFRCTDDQKHLAAKLFSRDEIREAFFSLPRNKTPGPDGYTAEFYIKCWDFVGSEVTESVYDFFATGKLLRQWNATHLVLIPKRSNADTMGDFRPISCLNTVYKVISKLLSSRLQALLTHVVSGAQSAFIPGRLLSENVLLASELVQGYNQKKITPRGMLKIDLKKAFDSLRWDFILAALKSMQLPELFISWIRECISTPSYSVCVNGQVGGFFQGSLGLRQGDPLSPYLFVLSMEVLSRLLYLRADSGQIGYHPKTATLKISHLMFADDIMVFFDGSYSSLYEVSDTLSLFSSWSNLHMNVGKTKLYLGGVSQDDKSAMFSLGYTLGELPVRYLGLPLMSRKLRISEYEQLIHKLTSRLNSWATKSLSLAGRVQLFNMVIMGLLNFWMSTFVLPKGCVKRITSLCSQFLWAGNLDRRAMAKVSWSKLALPKDEGGIGLRCLITWNTTLCLRFIWLLFSDSQSLWAQWVIENNLKGRSLWIVKEDKSKSWIWNIILRLRNRGSDFIRCDIGNGRLANFWHDNWCSLGQLIKVYGDSGPLLLRIPICDSVADVWRKHRTKLINPARQRDRGIWEYLAHIHADCSEDVPDSFHWQVHEKKFRAFSSSATWQALRPRADSKEWSKLIWFKGATPKHAFNLWLAQLDRLQTKSRLHRWGVAPDDSCVMCSGFQETRDHILLTCAFARNTWRESFNRLTPAQLDFHSWSDLIKWMGEGSASSPARLRRLVSQATIYHLWHQRNSRIHNGFNLSTIDTFRQIDQDVKRAIGVRRRERKQSSLMLLWLR